MNLIIFDLDGTLLNTIADLAVATNHALQIYGYPTHSIESYKQRVGNGINKLLERALPENARNESNVQQLRQAFIPYYNAHNACLTKPYEGIPQLLRQLQAAGKQIAVASNKYQQATEQLVTHFFPDIQFVAVLGQRENIPIKPNPQIVFDILQMSNQTAENALYIGDSLVDMQTARNAGVVAAAVTWGFCSPEILAQTQPNFLVNTPNEIAEIAQLQGL